MLYYNITGVHAWAQSQISALATLIARALLRFRPQGRAQATLKRGRRRPQGGRREDRVHAAPAISRANRTKENAHEHTGSAEAVRPSLRNGFTVSFVLSPVIGFLATVAPKKLASRGLDASIEAPGPHDFAVRNQSRSSVVAIASIASHRAFVTIASRPSYRVGWPMEDVIWVRTTAEYFHWGYWTQRWCNRPGGQHRHW